MESYKLGWDRLKSNWKFLAVGAIALIFTSSISDNLDKLNNSATLLITIPLFFVSLWLTVNFIKGVLRIYDKHETSPAKMFAWTEKSFNETLKYFGLSILMGIIVGVFAVPIAMLLVSALDGTYGLSWVDMAVGIAIIVAGVYVNSRLMFSSYIMMDDSKGVIDSMKTSWKMTHGNVLKLLGFYFVSILIAAVGYILLIIPGLIFSGIFIFAIADVYRKVKHSHAN